MSHVFNQSLFTLKSHERFSFTEQTLMIHLPNSYQLITVFVAWRYNVPVVFQVWETKQIYFQEKSHSKTWLWTSTWALTPHFIKYYGVVSCSPLLTTSELKSFILLDSLIIQQSNSSSSTTYPCPIHAPLPPAPHTSCFRSPKLYYSSHRWQFSPSWYHH